MVAVDTNILVYAHRSDSSWHKTAERVIRTLAEGAAAWAIPWPCIHEFLAVVTHPRIYDPPTPLGDPIEQVESWVESPALVLLTEGAGYSECLTRTLKDSKVRGAAIHDARIAALCEFHSIREILTADRDLSRFPVIRTRNPLQ